MDERVARRYARALFQAAQHQNALDTVSNELAQIDAMIKTQDELRFFVFSPLVARGAKANAIDKAFSAFSPLTLRILHLLVEKRREENLPLVRREFDRLREESAGIVHAVIQTASPLPPEQRAALIARVEQQTGKKLIVVDEIDPHLLGGARIRIGDTMLDGTVRTGLRLLRERFIEQLARQA